MAKTWISKCGTSGEMHISILTIYHAFNQYRLGLGTFVHTETRILPVVRSAVHILLVASTTLEVHVTGRCRVTLPAVLFWLKKR